MQNDERCAGLLLVFISMRGMDYPPDDLANCSHGHVKVKIFENHSTRDQDPRPGNDSSGLTQQATSDGRRDVSRATYTQKLIISQ